MIIENSSLLILRQTIKKLHDSRFQTILGTHDKQPIMLNQLLENFRAVAQMINRRTDVGSDSLMDQLFRI